MLTFDGADTGEHDPFQGKCGAPLTAGHGDEGAVGVAPAEMMKGAALIRTKGTFQSRAGLHEIEAADMDAATALGVKRRSMGHSITGYDSPAAAHR